MSGKNRVVNESNNYVSQAKSESTDISPKDNQGNGTSADSTPKNTHPEPGDSPSATPQKEQEVASTIKEPASATDTTEPSQEIIELDDLEDIEFLLDEIEDQIAPLAL